MISKEICREEFYRQRQYSQEVVSREVSQKIEPQKKSKKQSRACRHDDRTIIINFWSQHEALFSVKHPHYLLSN